MTNIKREEMKLHLEFLKWFVISRGGDWIANYEEVHQEITKLIEKIDQ